MIVVSVRNYSDFKILANALPTLSAVFYADSVPINGGTYGVGYAFDYAGEACVCCESPSFSLSTTDFPSAVLISDRLNVSTASALSPSF